MAEGRGEGRGEGAGGSGGAPMIRIEEDTTEGAKSKDGGEPARGILKKRGRIITPEER